MWCEHLHLVQEENRPAEAATPQNSTEKTHPQMIVDAFVAHTCQPKSPSQINLTVRVAKQATLMVLS